MGMAITSVTVTCEIADKNYGSGTRGVTSIAAKESDPGIPMDRAQEVMADGIELYLTAWQTLLQTRYAMGEMDGMEYKRQTAAFLLRIVRVQALYQKIKNKSTEELEVFLQTIEEKNVNQPAK